jgi:hypothetical protein
MKLGMAGATNEESVFESVVPFVFIFMVGINPTIGGTAEHATISVRCDESWADIADPIPAARAARPVSISRAAIQSHASIIAPISTAVKEKF